jgi:hypothetical protein
VLQNLDRWAEILNFSQEFTAPTPFGNKTFEEKVVLVVLFQVLSPGDVF